MAAESFRGLVHSPETVPRIAGHLYKAMESFRDLVQSSGMVPQVVPVPPNFWSPDFDNFIYFFVFGV